MPLYLITWLHLVAAITLMGGLVFILFVLKPALRGLTPESQEAEVLRRVGRKFRTLAWVSLITLILTGSYSLLNESGSARIETEWGVVLMLKLFVFAVVFGLFIIHDFLFDPYGPQTVKSGKQPSLPSNATRATVIQQAILVLTLGILLIASYLTTM